MAIFTDSFLKELEVSGWATDIKTKSILCLFHIRKRIFTCAAIEQSDVENGELIILRYEYTSRYAPTPRGESLLKKYHEQSGRQVEYIHPNKLTFTCFVSVYDSEDDELDFDSFEKMVYEYLYHFFGVVCAYEVCARLTEPTTRVIEKYRKVLPSQQVRMILNNHLVS